MKLFDTLEKISRIFARIGGGLVVVSAVLISLDVIFRNTIKATWFESFELSGYAFAISTAFGFAWALFAKAHIRIEVIYTVLPKRVRAWLDALALGVLAVCIAFTFYWCADVVWSNYEFGARSASSLNLPLALPQSFWLLGLAWFLVCTIAAFVLSLRLTVAGKLDEESRRFGVGTVNEEVEASITAKPGQAKSTGLPNAPSRT